MWKLNRRNRARDSFHELQNRVPRDATGRKRTLLSQRISGPQTSHRVTALTADATNLLGTPMFCPHAYRAAVWGSRQDIVGLCSSRWRRPDSARRLPPLRSNIREPKENSVTEPSRNEQHALRFGVIAEVAERRRPLVLLNLPLGRLIDEIIVPYDRGEPFFIDGVSIARNSITRIKVVELSGAFESAMREFENMLNRGKVENQRIWGDQYETRFEHILRM
jgi:hypothetical protein